MNSLEEALCVEHLSYPDDELCDHNDIQVAQETLKVRFSVEDTGIGINEKDRSRLFQIFGKIEHLDKNINS
jgi:signal transduction histidine kinase